MLLDFAEFPAAAQEWWERAELAQTWAGVEVGEEDEGWSSHVEQAKQTLDSIRSGKDRLGMPPDDLLMFWLSRPPPPRRRPRCAPTRVQAAADPATCSSAA